MSGMDNTTHQLHYPVDDATTRGQPAVPGAPAPDMPPVIDPPTTVMGLPTMATAPPESASGRVRPPEAQPAAGPAAAESLRRGRTTIADEVVERVIQKIVDLTVDEVEGVHGLRPGVGRFFHEPTEGQPAAGQPAGEAGDAPADQSVTVTLRDGRATINLAIEVDFGYAVHDVVDQVRGSVISGAEKLLGLTVAEVNVVVSDVSFDQPALAESAADTSGGRRTRTRT